MQMSIGRRRPALGAVLVLLSFTAGMFQPLAFLVAAPLALWLLQRNEWFSAPAWKVGPGLRDQRMDRVWTIILRTAGLLFFTSPVVGFILVFVYPDIAGFYVLFVPGACLGGGVIFAAVREVLWRQRTRARLLRAEFSVR